MRAHAPDGPTCAPPGAAPGLAYTLTALAVIAHNGEEGLGLAAWAGAHGLMEVHRAGFMNALVSVTLAEAAILVLGRTLQFNLWVQRVVAVLAGALLVNVVAHAGLSLATSSVMPGLYTALLLIAPTFGWLMLRLPLPRREKLIATAVGAVALVVVSNLALRLSGAIG